MEDQHTRVVPLKQTNGDNTLQQKQTNPARKKRKQKAKKIPVWGKALIIFGLIFASLVFGLMIGYSVIGNGPVGDVFSFSTWKHILDLIIG